MASKEQTAEGKDDIFAIVEKKADDYVTTATKWRKLQPDDFTYVQRDFPTTTYPPSKMAFMLLAALQNQPDLCPSKVNSGELALLKILSNPKLDDESKNALLYGTWRCVRMENELGEQWFSQTFAQTNKKAFRKAIELWTVGSVDDDDSDDDDEPSSSVWSRMCLFGFRPRLFRPPSLLN
jgi:hypothetical protein